MVCAISATAYAASDVTTSDFNAIYGDVYDDSIEDCAVVASQASSFTVSIPKSIAMDGATGTATYTVSVRGNIAGTETLTVKPDSTFSLVQSGKSNLNVTVGQYADNTKRTAKTTWQYAELASGSTAYGYIAVSGSTPVSAGTWSGAFDFTIRLS